MMRRIITAVLTSAIVLSTTLIAQASAIGMAPESVKGPTANITYAHLVEVSLTDDPSGNTPLSGICTTPKDILNALVAAQHVPAGTSLSTLAEYIRELRMHDPIPGTFKMAREIVIAPGKCRLDAKVGWSRAFTKGELVFYDPNTSDIVFAGNCGNVVFGAKLPTTVVATPILRPTIVPSPTSAKAVAVAKAHVICSDGTIVDATDEAQGDGKGTASADASAAASLTVKCPAAATPAPTPVPVPIVPTVPAVLPAVCKFEAHRMQLGDERPLYVQLAKGTPLVRLEPLGGDIYTIPCEAMHVIPHWCWCKGTECGRFADREGWIANATTNYAQNLAFNAGHPLKIPPPHPGDRPVSEITQLTPMGMSQVREPAAFPQQALSQAQSHPCRVDIFGRLLQGETRLGVIGGRFLCR